MEAFEIELLLGVPIGAVRLFDKNPRPWSPMKPPEYAAATALGSIFLGAAPDPGRTAAQLISASVSDRTVSGRGFSTNPTSLGRWTLADFLGGGFSCVHRSHQ